MTAVNAGARLDRLPVSSFHYNLLGLIAAGMFLDGFDIYLQGGVLASLVASGWSTPAMNANFISATFAGMVIGASLAGMAGDHFGRRFAYQVNLLVFGLASLAGAAAVSMSWLIAARLVMGIGLGAEIVVGYVTISEFVPPGNRGRWGGGFVGDHQYVAVCLGPVGAGDHSELRLALDVRAGWRGCVDCVVHAPLDAGIAALAGIEGPLCRGRGGAVED